MQNDANLTLLNDAICYIESSIQVTSLDPAIIDEKSERLRVSLLQRIDHASSDDDENSFNHGAN